MNLQSFPAEPYRGMGQYWWLVEISTENDCNTHTSDAVVSCNISQECLSVGQECATDLDCCNTMYCSPVQGNCTDPVTYSRLLALLFCVTVCCLNLQLTYCLLVMYSNWC